MTLSGALCLSYYHRTKIIGLMSEEKLGFQSWNVAWHIVLFICLKVGLNWQSGLLDTALQPPFDAGFYFSQIMMIDYVDEFLKS